MNEKKRLFIAANDYGQGAVLYRIFARNEDEVSAIFQPPDWEICTQEELIGRGIPGLDSLRESDVDAKADWLLDHIKRTNLRRVMEAQGKDDIPFFGIRNGKVVYREIWARSVAEVRKHYPSLVPMYGMVQTPQIWKQMATSDIDQPDEFLEEFRTQRQSKPGGMQHLVDAVRQLVLRRSLQDAEKVILAAVRERYPEHPNDRIFFIREPEVWPPMKSVALIQIWGDDGDGPWINLTTLATLLRSGMTLDAIKQNQLI